MNKNGTLYIVATPIGNLADITLRALEILKEVALIAAEDTRHSQKLLNHYAIHTPLISLHQHNEGKIISKLIKRLQEGESIALISDAGTPLIHDPGQYLVHSAYDANVRVVPIPGACAAITALSAAGLPADEFVFLGFLPAKALARQSMLKELLTEPRTTVLYEAPHRIMDLFDDMLKILNSERQIVIAKELTKTFETIYRGTLKEVHEWLLEDPLRQKGEFVVLVSGVEKKLKESTLDNQRILQILLKELPTNQAVKLAAQITGEKKNVLYEKALQLKS